MNRLKTLLFKYQDVFFPVFDVLLNGFNFFMHIYISWFISMNDYSILNALLSLLAILFVLGISIQTYTNKEVGKAQNQGSIASSIFSLLVIIMMVVNGVLLIFMPVIMTFMRTNIINVILIMLIFDVNIMLSFFRGLMQGRQMFLKLNISFYIEVITKLIFVIAVLPFFGGTVVPLGGILVGMLFSFGHAFLLLHKELDLGIRFSKKLKDVFKTLVHVIWSNFFLYYLTSISLIMANYYIGEQAGLYAVSLKFSQLILAVGLSVITVLVSYSSGLVEDKVEFHHYITKWLIRFCLGSIVIIGGYQLILRHMIGFLFGDAYAGAKEFMVIQAFAYILLTISYYIISIMIILNEKVHLYILAVVSGLLTIGLILNHGTIQSIITIEVISFAILFIGLLIWFVQKRRQNESA